MNPLDGLSPDQKRELLARMLKQKSAQASSQPDAPPAEFPMSAGQKGLWYAFRRDPDVTAYNVFMPSRFRSPVDLDVMQRVIEELVNRHSALRTVFDETPSDQRPIQRVVAELPPEFRRVDAASWTEERIEQAVLEETQRPFDLTKGPLLRIAAFVVAKDNVVIVATTHHISVDFWSLVQIMDEVRQMYPAFAANQTPNLPPAPQNYYRFVEWQSQLSKGVNGRSHADYWEKQLSDVRPVLQWATDYHRPARFTNRAAVKTIRFSPGIAPKIASLAKRLHVTSNVVVMAMLQVLVARQSEQESFSIGAPFSGRSGREYEKTVGFFVNLLPIKADLTDSPSLETLVRRVGKTMVDALAHEPLPFSEIVRENAPGRDASRHPLFQVSCTFEQSHVASEKGRAGFLLGDEQAFDDFAGMRQESYFVQHPTCHYDIEFIFELLDDSLRGMICYCRDLFSAETIDVMAKHFSTLADELLANPSGSVFDAPWCETLAATTPHAETPTLSESTIVQLLGQSGDPILADANSLATELVRQGVRPGEVVPVCLPRGSQAWSAMLGVMMAGAVVVPLDSAQPAVSLTQLADDAEIRFVVGNSTDAWCISDGIQVIDSSNVASGESVTSSTTHHPVDADSLAYIIYTSGSTGTPKGVMIQHGAIANTLAWRKKSVTLSADDRVLVLVSHQFDAAMAVVLSALHQGATLCWPRESATLDIDNLIDQIIQDQITVLPAVPSLHRALVNHPRFSECVSLRQIWSGGESMTVELVEQVRELSAKGPSIDIWNFYGPTEAAVEATAHRIKATSDNQTISIGYPIDGASVHVLDQRLRPVPDGVPGQLAIGGNGLALGYLNRPELTQQAFVNLEHSGETAEAIQNSNGNNAARVYLTGDRGRRRGDGSFEFLGRLDHQVKVRGYRIELEEIERTIEQAEHVRRAAVKVVGAGTPSENLAAFVEADPLVRVDRVRQWLAEQLPPFKRPLWITVVEKLPLGTSGKVQRDRLPEPQDDPSHSSKMIEPRSALERFMCEQFCETLELDEISVEANFFEAGGTSLQAAMLTSRLSGELGYSIPTSLLFDLGDVASITSRLVTLYESDITARFGIHSVSRAVENALKKQGHELLAVLKPSGSMPPVFMIHPPGGIVVCYREMATSMPEERPLVAVRSRGVHGDETLPESIAEMASDYADAIESYQDAGPYTLGGWSLGGVIAYEVAQQLIQRGHDVSQLILLDSTVPERSDDGPTRAGEEYGIELSLSELSNLSDSQQLPMLYDHAEQLGVLDDETPEEVIKSVIEDLRKLFAHHVTLCEAYELQPLPVPLMLLRPSEIPVAGDPRPDRGWGRWTGEVTVKTVTGHHHSMVKLPGAAEIAQQLAVQR